MPRLQRFKAWVEVGGRRLPEFNVTVNADGTTVTCYIPSKEGRRFEIHWEDERKRHLGTCGHVTVDGQFIDGQYIESWRESLFADGHVSVAKVPISSTGSAPIQFGKLLLTDQEELAAQDQDSVKDIGSIVIEISTGILTCRTGFSRRPLETKIVHEREKKALTHCTEASDDVTECRQEFFDFFPDGGMELKFVFLYRSKDYLQAQDIMPRNDPVPPASYRIDGRSKRGDPIASGSRTSHRRGREEDDDLKPKIQPQDDVRSGPSSRKGGFEGGRNPKRVKTDPSRSNWPFAPGEVIDLTEELDDPREVKRVKREHSESQMGSQPRNMIDLPRESNKEQEQREKPRVKRHDMGPTWPFHPGGRH